MTTVGDILDEFFSPISSETLWVMPESDNYTQIVRKWLPVINSVNRIKANLMRDSATWSLFYVTDQYAKGAPWKPTMTDTPKYGAFRDFVPSPLGTEPVICKAAFITYAKSKAKHIARNVIPLGPIIIPPTPVIQTNNLYTCSIGSFNIYTTVDAMDYVKKTATLNFWMYNSMSKRSFGDFADDKTFIACGMKTQFMWWNWVERVDWSSGMMHVLPPLVSAKAPKRW